MIRVTARSAPDHVTVHRNLTPGTFAANGTVETSGLWDISIAADYEAPVELAGVLFHIHFTPAISHSAPIIVK
ncbi:MAG TPA: hypothetical protein VJS43_02880 [Candidatus Acidoferrales bacterium]|nr:hypothetical protein [Candidatus Acidoferrales bacterium]